MGRIVYILEAPLEWGLGRMQNFLVAGAESLQPDVPIRGYQRLFTEIKSGKEK